MKIKELLAGAVPVLGALSASPFPDGLTHAEILEVTGLNKERLMGWHKRALLPSGVGSASPGRGNRRRYSVEAAGILAMCRALADDGLDLEDLAPMGRRMWFLFGGEVASWLGELTPTEAILELRSGTSASEFLNKAAGGDQEPSLTASDEEYRDWLDSNYADLPDPQKKWMKESHARGREALQAVKFTEATKDGEGLVLVVRRDPSGFKKNFLGPGYQAKHYVVLPIPPAWTEVDLRKYKRAMGSPQMLLFDHQYVGADLSFRLELVLQARQSS